MNTHSKYNVTELLVNASVMQIGGGEWDLTDAGPPPSPLFLFFWLCASVLGYVIFVIARPLARVKADEKSGGQVWTKERKVWLARQLYSIPWAWFLTDQFHRLFCYLLLRPTTLWRRQMLPLPAWMDPWLSQLRLYLFCGSLLEGFNPRLRAFYASTMEYLDHHATPDSSFDTSHECGVDWLLPVGDSLLAPSAHMLEKVSAFPSDAAKSTALHEYRMVALYAVLASVFVCFYIFLQLVPRIYARNRKASETTREGKETVPETNKTEAHAPSILVVPEREPTGQPKLARGEADDAWLDSPEAAAEEVRWAKREEARRQKLEEEAERARSRGMTATVRECWPSLLACLYGGLFAVVGGMPLLMLLLFPAFVVVSIVASIALV